MRLTQWERMFPTQTTKDYAEHVHNCSGGKTAEGRVRDPKGRRERGGREEGSACEKVPEYVSAQKCT